MSARAVRAVDQVLSTRQVLQMTGKHRVTIYRRIRAGIFPEKHERLGHKVGWLRSDIEAYLQRAPPPGSWLARAGLPRTRGDATNQATPAAMRQARGCLKQIQDLLGNGAAA